MNRLAFLFLSYFIPGQLLAVTILTLDIGGTRIKSSYIRLNQSDIVSIEQNTPDSSIPLFKAKKNFSKLLASWIKSSLLEKKVQIDGIAIGFPGPVLEGGIGIQWDESGNSYKTPVKQDIETEFSVPVVVVNDMIPWAEGIAYLLGDKLNGKLPMLVVTMGTGFGLGYIREDGRPETQQAFMVGHKNFRRLKRFLTDQEFNSDLKIHQMFGHNLVRYGTEKGWTTNKIFQEFSERLNASVLDILEFYKAEKNIQFNSVSISGGFSWKLNKQSFNLPHELYFIRDFETSSVGFDAIPLKGLGITWIKNQSTYDLHQDQS